jgi:aminopeptidase N
MATYLAFAAMGDYSLTTGTAGGVPFYTAIAAKVGKYVAAAKADLARTPEVIAWESTLFGPYPFDSMGAVVPDGDLGYALENQTKPVYDRIFWRLGSAMYVVVHENAHEWFGDSVSVDRWKDIWLNEGFATYAEWLWSEHQNQGTAQSVFDFMYSQPRSPTFWTTKVADPTVPETFSDAVYDRGGMTLHALRVRIGDGLFFALLQDWVAAHQGGTASTAQFIALAEQESGQDLTAFFAAWLYSPTKPAPTVDNGFPAGFAPAATPVVPQSAAALAAAHALLTGSRH